MGVSDVFDPFRGGTSLLDDWGLIAGWKGICPPAASSSFSQCGCQCRLLCEACQPWTFTDGSNASQRAMAGGKSNIHGTMVLQCKVTGRTEGCPGMVV